MLLLPLLVGCAYYRWETTKANLEKADVIIVPGYALSEQGDASWLLWNRVLMGRILMERGYGDRFYFTGGKPRGGVSEARKMLAIALELGIDKDRIYVDDRARSSVENGRHAAEVMVEKGWGSGLVVSDPRHLGYAIPVFRDAFEENELALFWTPVDYDLLKEHPDARRPPR